MNQARAVVGIRPGDHILIGMSDMPDTAEEGEQFRNQLEEELPGVRITVVFGVTAIARYEPGEEQE